MLSPTRSSAQAILKAVVTTTSAVLQESTSTSVEQKEESNDTDDNEPEKKKFKNDNETEVETSTTTTTQVRQRPPKKRKVCVSFGYCGMFCYSIIILLQIFYFRCWLFRSSTVKFQLIFQT